MLKRGFIPHFETSNALLVGLTKAGKIPDATKTLYGLADRGFAPAEGTWNCLITSVCKERKLSKVTERFQRILEGED